MRTDDRLNVRTWLEAERAGRIDEADRQFKLLAVALPRLGPLPGFAERVLVRVRAAIAPAPAMGLWNAWWLHGLVAASVITLGAVLGSWSARAVLFTVLASIQTVAWGLARTGAALQAWVGTALTVWEGVAHAGIVIGRLLVAPAPALMLTLNLAVAASAVAALQRLLARQED